MFTTSIKRVRTDKQVAEYQRIFSSLSGVTFPRNYLMTSKSYLLYNKKKPVGGFVIASKRESRVIAEIPKSGDGIEALMVLNRFKSISELNGYFITDRKLGFILVTFWLLQIIVSKSSHFIYAYDSSNKALKKYYGRAKPIRIYDGIVLNLDGMVGHHFEKIEIMSKFGFIRLYLNRLFRWKGKKWI